MKHTPGPWTFNGHHVYTATDDSYIVAKGVNAKANAHLIAAAPDLLEALIEMADRFAGLRELAGFGPSKLDDKMRAAIRKATGEA